MQEEKFYLKDTKTEKYVSIIGLVSDIKEASQFTDEQVKRRFGVTKTHHNVLKEKMANSHMVLIPVHEREVGLKVISDISYDEDDILICSGEFRYRNGDVIKRDMVIYSPYRPGINIPICKNGQPELIVLTVKKTSGKVIR